VAGGDGDGDEVGKAKRGKGEGAKRICNRLSAVGAQFIAPFNGRDTKLQSKDN
jgi:hypothetical protein